MASMQLPLLPEKLNMASARSATEPSTFPPPPPPGPTAVPCRWSPIQLWVCGCEADDVPAMVWSGNRGEALSAPGSLFSPAVIGEIKGGVVEVWQVCCPSYVISRMEGLSSSRCTFFLASQPIMWVHR